MGKPRSLYTSEQPPTGPPTLADYCAAMDAVDLHTQEAVRHLEQIAALMKEMRGMVSLWRKTNEANIAAMAENWHGKDVFKNATVIDDGTGKYWEPAPEDADSAVANRIPTRDLPEGFPWCLPELSEEALAEEDDD